MNWSKVFTVLKLVIEAIKIIRSFKDSDIEAVRGGVDMLNFIKANGEEE